MRIFEVGIENFGLFNDCIIHLSPKMNIIQGENEAGKSTLLTFVRWVLFGFARNEKLVPFSGGDPSGYLLVDLDGKECVIRRQGKSLKGELSIVVDGKNLTGKEAEHFLAKLLGSITDNVYKNVFAFGLGELQQISTVEDDQEVSSFLYSSGLYPGKLPLSAITKELEDKSKALYSPSRHAKNPLINQELRSWEEIEDKLGEFKNDPEKYNSCLKEIEETGKELTHISERIRTLQEKRDWLGVLSKGRPTWSKIQEIKTLMELIEVDDEFPAESLGHVEKLKAEIEECENRLLVLNADLSTHNEELNALVLDEKILENAAEIEFLSGELSRFTEWKSGVQGLQDEITALEESLEKQIVGRLGNGWNLDKLKEEERTFSYEINDTVRKTEERFKDQEFAIKQAGEKIEAADTKKRTLDQEEETLQEELQRLDVIDNFPEIKDAFETYRHLAPSRAFLKGQIEAQKEPKAKPKKLSPVLFLIPAVLLAVLSGVFGLKANWPLAVAGATGAAFSIGLQIVASRRYKKALVAWQEQESKRLEELEKLLDEMKKIDAKLELAKEVLPSSASSDQANLIDLIQKHIEAEEDKWQKREELQRKLGHLATEKAKCEDERKAAEAALKEALKLEEESRSQWEAFLRENDLPQMEPLNILDWLSAYRELKTRVDELRQKAVQKNAVQANIKQFTEKAENLALRLGKNLENVEIDVVSWKKELSENNDTLLKKERLETEVKRIETQIKIEAEKKKGKSEELDGILEKAKVSTVEEFRTLAKRKTDKDELRKQLALHQSNLISLVSGEESRQKLLADLASFSEAELQKDINDTDLALASARTEQNQASEKLGRLQEQRSQLETGRQTEELLRQKASTKQKLSEYAKQWSQLVICRYLIEKARATYEREKQPGVLKTASTYFEKITNGNYIKVMSPLTEQRFEVLSRDRKVKGTNELSRGTLEQLALCLRLGLILEFAKHQTPLPLVIDDILVNFDPNRAANTLRILADLESMHQVLFFTCQTHLVGLCEDNNIEFKLTVLKNGKVVSSA